MRKLFNNVFRGKTVLVTGHTGFKGSWLSIWLKKLGARVIGYALEPYTENDIFVVAGVRKIVENNIGDIRDFDQLIKIFDKYGPEIVFHLAAQPLVRLSYQQPKLTYDTNIGGTVNVLECCRASQSVKVIINVTSDKCYENKEWPWRYRENDTLGGYDPYSSSKGCCEIITAAYRNSFFNAHNKFLASVRAGNVIGGGDWREDRLVPDCIRALIKGETVRIRSPRSVRPWQHVLDPLNGYLLLAARMYENGAKYAGAWNFGPRQESVITVQELVEKIIHYWGSGEYMDLSGQSMKDPHEAGLLMLDISKAIKLLKWAPVLGISKAIEFTVNWYRERSADHQFCVGQINDYMALSARQSSNEE